MFRIDVMVATPDLEAVFDTCRVSVVMIYPSTTIQMPSINDSFIATKSNAKEHFRTTAMLSFYVCSCFPRHNSEGPPC